MLIRVPFPHEGGNRLSHRGRRGLASVVFAVALLTQAGCSRLKGFFERSSVLTPVEVFQKASPSVFVIEALSEDGKPLMLGSGVALAQDLVITNCHVVRDGATLRIRRGEKNWTARLIVASPEHDLCGIRPAELSLHPVLVRPSSELATGEHVYAVGSPEGLELTFSEGVISALRDAEGVHVIQTSAPTSPGSSGGGLFDTHAKLVGITTFQLKEGQSLNFALPGEWIKATLDRVTAPSSRKDDVELESTAWLQIGLEALKSEDYIVAVHSLRKSADLKQGDAFRSWSELGKIWNKAWTHWEASSKYKDWLCTEVPCPLGFVGESTIRDAREQALRSFENAIKLNPNYGEAWCELASLYAQRKEYDRAMAAAKESARLDPSNWWSWAILTMLYLDKGSYDEAIQASVQGGKVASDHHSAMLLLCGKAYAGKGDRKEVLRIYQQLKSEDAELGERFFRSCVIPNSDPLSECVPHVDK